MHLLSHLRSARPLAAVGTAVALLATSSALAGPSWAEAPDWATVTGHEPHSSTNNRIATWCGLDANGMPNGIKVEGGLGGTYQLPERDAPYGIVVVKAASNNVPAPNTIFGEPPTALQWVWADTNASSLNQDNGPDEGDKTISHIIICRGTQPPPTTSLTVTKQWAAQDEDDAAYADALTPEDAGTLGVTIAGEVVEDPIWGQRITDLPIGAKAEVSEGDDFTLPDRAGYTCEVVDTTFDPAATVDLGKEATTVVVTNTVDCTKNPPPPPATGSLEAVKQWSYSPAEVKELITEDPTPGTLTFTADGDVRTPAWGDPQEYTEGTDVTVTENLDTAKPPTVPGWTCTVTTSGQYPTFTVGDGQPSTTAVVTIKGDTTVTVTNQATCTKNPPPPPATTSLTVTKQWAYEGRPDGWTLTSDEAGVLTVTVNGQPTGQAWGTTVSQLPVGAPATVSEGEVEDPIAPDNYSCTITGTPQYSVNGMPFGTSPPQFALAATENSVVVLNTVTCGEVGGTEEDTDGGTEDGTDDEIVDSAEDELADTGADFGPAGLGALLVLTGAALVAARRRAAA